MTSVPLPYYPFLIFYYPNPNVIQMPMEHRLYVVESRLQS